MDVKGEIARKVDYSPTELRERVPYLFASTAAGENGAALHQFSSSLDSVSAQQMIRVIEAECEQVEAGDW
jgi:hypothetical protein